MASLSHSDFALLAEEKFDFDVSLSPSSSKGDDDVEDEVFIGPAGHKEKCISQGVEIYMKDSLSSGPSLGEEASWSPLTGEKFEEIFKEANLLASHLEQTITDSVVESSVVSSSQAEDTETFEEDTTTKLSMFTKPAHVLSPIKRETFLVQDSPMKQLPPAIQKRMLKAGGPSRFGKPRLSTSSPVRPAVMQPKIAGRSKALVASSGVLPSKPTTQGGTRLSSSTKLPAVTKTRLQPPSKGNFGMKRSPNYRNTSRAGSSEDLLSDTTSVASDISDSSLNTSLSGKTSIPAHSKTEIRAPSALKAPLIPNSRTVDQRRNTSSSSSSVSSINSSLTISPGSKAKLNSSLNSSINIINGRSHTSVSRLPSSSRKSSVVTRNAEPPVSRRTSMSTQGRRGSELLPRQVKATPIKKVDPVPPPQYQTPAKNTLGKNTSASNVSASAAKLGSALKGNPKIKAPVVPTPINYLKGVRKSEVSSSPDVPRIMKPKRLLSACSVESLIDNLVGPTPMGLLTPSAVGSKLRRPSALPTPVNRRISGIPAPTPKSVSRLSKPTQNTVLLSALGQGSTHLSPSNLKEIENQEVKEAPLSNEETCSSADLQPCSLVFSLENETEEPPTCKPAVVENSSEPSSCDLEPSSCDLEPSSCDLEPSSCDLEPSSCDPVPSSSDPPEPSSCDPVPSSCDPVPSSCEPVPSSCDPVPSSCDLEPSSCDPVPSSCGPPEQSSCDPEPFLCHPEPSKISLVPPTLPCTVDTKVNHLQKKTEKHDIKEVMLVDVPAPALRPKEKLLIDLSNTPDLLKTSTAKPWGGQLIDLSSPLIKWSPEDKKENTENEALLIDLSF